MSELELPEDVTALEARVRGALALATPPPALDARILAQARLRARPQRTVGWGGKLAAAAAALAVTGVGVWCTWPGVRAVSAPQSVAAGAVAEVVDGFGALGPDGLPLERGARLEEDDAVAVRPGGRLSLRLAGGAEVALDGGARARLEGAQLQLEEGRLYARVDEGSLWVRSPGGRAEVQGGECTLSAGRSRTVVAVRAGSVRLENSLGALPVGAAGVGSLVAHVAPQVRRSSAVERHFRWVGQVDARPHHPCERPFAGVVTDGAALGELTAATGEGERRLRLLEQRVEVTLQHGLADCEVSLWFDNPLDEVAEGVFRIALPKDASVREFVVWGPEGPRRAQVLPRAEAEARYLDARERWEDTGLLAWDRGGAFEVRVSPLVPGEPTRVRLRYGQPLPERRGVTRFVYPLSGSDLPPLERFVFRCDVRGVEAGAAWRSPSHYVERRAGAEGPRLVVEAEGLAPRNDVVLELAPRVAPAAELTWGAADPRAPDTRTVVVRARPDVGGAGVLAPAEVVVVCDLSRSQDGVRREIQLELLEALFAALPRTTRVQVFGAHVGLEALGGSADREEALAALWSAEPLGGSDWGACFAELGERLAPDLGGVLVYVGDGVATVGEREPERLWAAFAEALPASMVRKVVTVGVGSDVDTEWLRRCARARGGVATTIQPGDDLDARLEEATASLTEPVWTRVQAELRLRGAEVVASAPAALPNLRAGEAATWAARVRLRRGARWEDVSGRVELCGSLDGRLVRWGAECATEQGGDGVEYLWARARVGDLLSGGAEGEALELALAHELVTPLTSLWIPSAEVVTRSLGNDALLLGGADTTVFFGSRSEITLASSGDLGVRWSTSAPTQRDRYFTAETGVVFGLGETERAGWGAPSEPGVVFGFEGPADAGRGVSADDVLRLRGEGFEAAARVLLREAPGDLVLCEALARALAEEGRVWEAYRVLSEVLEVDPDDPERLAVFARVLAELRR